MRLFLELKLNREGEYYRIFYNGDKSGVSIRSDH